MLAIARSLASSSRKTVRMAKEKWTNDRVLKLLTEVEKKPCVWKKSDPSYLKKDLKKAAFEEIGAAIGVSANESRDKLRNMRTNFMQIYKKQTKSEGGAGHLPKWKFYNAMMFMNGEATTAGDTDSVYFKVEVDEKTNDNEDNSIFSESNQTNFSISAPPTSNRRHNPVNDDLASALSQLYEQLSQTREPIHKTKSPNEKFAIEIVSVLNNIPHENIVKRAKAHIQLILADSMAESARRDLADSDDFSRTQSPNFEFRRILSTTQGSQYQMEQQDDQKTPSMFSQYAHENE